MCPASASSRATTAPEKPAPATAIRMGPIVRPATAGLCGLARVLLELPAPVLVAGHGGVCRSILGFELVESSGDLTSGPHHFAEQAEKTLPVPPGYVPLSREV